ncbi:MAG: HlyD family type I secretion periplasmic adaptor subunit [Pararhodobacter sp.]|nr:HlyD family type I secretion periplasmic adaptor subunit [Pararhodobacter sp.]
MSGAAGWQAWRALVIGALAALVLVAGFGGWAVTATLSGAVVVSGQIEVERNLQVVQHPDGGVIEAVLAVEGQQVAAGQVLLRLDGSMLQSEMAIVESQYFEALARQARLNAEREGHAQLSFAAPLTAAITDRSDARDIADGQRRLFEARRLTLHQQIAQLERRREQNLAQLDGLSAQRQATRREAELLHTELAGQERLLSQGLIQGTRVSTLQRDAARLEGALGAITAEIAQVHGRITEIALQTVTLEASRREEAEGALRELGIRVIELAERRRTLSDYIARLELRAPVSGRVHGLQITTPRAVLRPAEPLLQIVPHDRPLVLSVRIRPDDIDQVFVGQEASVLFPAFSLRNMPDLRGTVTMVSADAFMDERIGLRYFRAEIVLSPEAESRLGAHALMPGMPVEAYIRTGERTPLDYLTRPLTEHLFRAFRES